MRRASGPAAALAADGPGGGHFAIGGTAQPAQTHITVASLANLTYVAADAAGSESLWAQAFDGQEWGPWKNWNMGSTASLSGG